MKKMLVFLTTLARGLTTGAALALMGVITVTANFGTCAEDPRCDVWYGTGELGTNVSIASGFGPGGGGTIGEKGKWDLKVEFFEAPCNKTI